MTYNEKIRGWMSVPELEIIESWASRVPRNGTIVEIGSMLGRSAFCWASSCDPSVSVYCIDSWNGRVVTQKPENLERFRKENIPVTGDCISLDSFLQNVGHLKNVIPVKANSPDEFPDTVKLLSPDAVFIDAAHANPSDWEYIEYWLPKIRKCGMLCGHDYQPMAYPVVYPDIVENVKRLEILLNQRVRSYKPYSLWSFVVGLDRS